MTQCNESSRPKRADVERLEHEMFGVPTEPLEMRAEDHAPPQAGQLEHISHRAFPKVDRDSLGPTYWVTCWCGFSGAGCATAALAQADYDAHTHRERRDIMDVFRDDEAMAAFGVARPKTTALPGNQEPANVCLRTGKHISDCDEAELCAHCDGSKKGC